MHLNFEDLLEQARDRPMEEQLELIDILKRNLIEARRDEIARNHSESLKELANGKLKFSSDVDELMRQLKDE
jgi:hypothetical protein